MSSEEDVPAPSPSAAVVARRAGREAKSMREESGSDKDAEEPEEWDDDGEASSDEDESDEEARVSNAQRGRVRLHGVSQSSAGLEVDDDRRKSLGEKGWARRAVVVRAVEPSGAADFEAVPGREEYDLGEDGSAEWAKDMLEFADDNFNDAGNEVRSMDQRDRQVGLFGDFCERTGHGKFVEWRADKESGGLYKLVLVTQVVEGESGELSGLAPSVPTWGMVMEYVVKSATGHPSAPKGGTPEYRNGPWYKARRGRKEARRRAG